MSKVISLAKIVVVLIIVLLIGGIFVEYYSFIFSRVVTGPIVRIERDPTPMIIQGGEAPGGIPSQIFSYAVAIEDKKTSEILVASSEDRQWGAVEVGNCATARYYPYPPWKLDKSGTYHNARLLHLLKSCDEKKE